METLDILSVEAGLEPHALRAVGEYWGARVRVIWAATARDIVDYFRSEPQVPLIVIAGHGDERGLLLPDLDPELEREQPFSKVIRPQDLQAIVRLTGSAVLNTCCAGGTPEFAQSFLSSGASCYAGVDGYPDGNDALRYALEFVYQLLILGRTPAEAHAAATSPQDDRGMFRLFERESV